MRRRERRKCKGREGRGSPAFLSLLEKWHRGTIIAAASGECTRGGADAGGGSVGVVVDEVFLPIREDVEKQQLLYLFSVLLGCVMGSFYQSICTHRRHHSLPLIGAASTFLCCVPVPGATAPPPVHTLCFPFSSFMQSPITSSKCFLPISHCECR